MPGFVPPGFIDASYTASGVAGGVQGGFNYQVGRIVLGVKADWDWANLKGSAGCFGFPGGAIQGCNTKLDSIATLIGRVGMTWDRALFYVKGGGAWVRDVYSNPCTDCFRRGPAVWNASETREGWTVGIAIECAFAAMVGQARI